MRPFHAAANIMAICFQIVLVIFIIPFIFVIGAIVGGFSLVSQFLAEVSGFIGDAISALTQKGNPK